MLRRRGHNPASTSHSARMHPPAGAGKGVKAEQPVLALQVGSHTDPGIRRKHSTNEDTIGVTQGIVPSASPSTLPQPFALLTTGVQYANQVVYQRNRERREQMGTTMTAALAMDTTAYVAHVSDSRLYLYRQPTGLAQITRDHSVVARLVAAGIIASEDIYTHPMRNRISRSLGDKATVEVDSSAVPLVAGDLLLLCSDGLWEMVRDQQIAAILTTLRSHPSQTALALVRTALAGGGKTISASLWCR
jgi:hypothetical protein